MINFQCQGCRHERTEDDTPDARQGFCTSCVASGKSLKPIVQVRKWQARDGSYHDTLRLAEEHQLRQELETALKVGDGYVQRQAAHLLSHFNIARKGERAPLPIPPTVEPPRIRARSPITILLVLALDFIFGFAYHWWISP